MMEVLLLYSNTTRFTGQGGGEQGEEARKHGGHEKGQRHYQDQQLRAGAELNLS